MNIYFLLKFPLFYVAGTGNQGKTCPGALGGHWKCSSPQFALGPGRGPGGHMGRGHALTASHGVPVPPGSLVPLD